MMAGEPAWTLDTAVGCGSGGRPLLQLLLRPHSRVHMESWMDPTANGLTGDVDPRPARDITHDSLFRERRIPFRVLPVSAFIFAAAATGRVAPPCQFFVGRFVGRQASDSKEERTTGNMDEENKEASVSISNNDTGTNDLEDDDYDDDDGKHAVVLGPQVPLKDHLELDKDDDSLRRWKEQLLGDVDTTKLGETAEPEVTILNLTILSPERPDLVLPIPLVPDDKGYAFALKDDSTYSFRFSFTVSNNIVSGLRYTHTVWKTGVRVEKQKVMLGTFSPQQEPYTYEAEEDTTPSGIFARGSYSAKLKFVDDDGKVYLDMSYCFEIRKDWPASAQK